MGSWVTHPEGFAAMPADRDYVLLLNAYDISPGSYTPKVSTMLDFNLWTFNSRAFPGTDPMVARLGERVRIRVGNLTMTNHPIHLHGHEFVVAGTDGGWTAPSRAMARGDDGHCRRSNARDRVHRGRPRRLGVSLPQEPPHHECHEPCRADDAGGGNGRSREADHRSRARLHGCGRQRLDGRHANEHAAAGQHLADDGGVPVRTETSKWAACSRSSRSARTLRTTTIETRAGIGRPSTASPIFGRTRRRSRRRGRTSRPGCLSRIRRRSSRPAPGR